MKKLTFLLLNVFLMLSFVSAATYENLYVVGNGCDAGWDPDKAIELTMEEEGIFTWSGKLYKPVNDQQRFKFLVARSWSTSLTCRLDEDGHLMIESGQEYPLSVRGESDETPDNAFQVPEDGTYSIRIDLTNESDMKVIITKTGDAEEPEPDLTFLYLTGSALSEDGTWDFDNPIQMTMKASGVFAWTGHVYNSIEGNEFKFKNIADSWDKTFCAVDDTDENRVVVPGEYDLIFRPYESSPGDNNFVVNTPGYYRIEVNMNTLKMKVEIATGIDNVAEDFYNKIIIEGNSVKLSVEDNVPVQSAAIFNVTGKCINSVSGINSPATLAENLTNGIYIVRIVSGDKELTQKIIIK